MSYRLGIDLGGTSAKIALVGPSNKIIQEGLVPTVGFPKPARLVQRMVEVAQSLLQGKKVTHLGVGVAGDIDSAQGVVRVSPNLGWKRVPLRKLIQKHIRCQVTVENDANAAAWGLYQTQAPKYVKNVIVMTLGTGVGGGIILDGKLFRGSTGSAGEVGHINIDENGPLCNCGNRGCLETYVGGPHIMRKVRAALGKGRRSLLQNIFQNNPDDLTPFAVAQAAHRGDAFAKSVWNEVGHALGVAVGDLVYVLNPEMIYFTGGVAQAQELILKPLWRTLSQRAFKTPIGAVKIKVASEASQIGVIGASLL